MKLTNDVAEEHQASWSPDGARIAFAYRWLLQPRRLRHGRERLEPSKVHGVRRYHVAPVWSPDGRWIAFASDREATPAQREKNQSGEAPWSGLSTYVIRADGSEVTLLLQGDAAIPVPWTA